MTEQAHSEGPSDAESEGVGTASLAALFRPSSVAVIGASRDPEKVGHRIFRSILDGGFQGPVFPVNPQAKYVSSVKAYPGMAEVPDPVDLAVIAVPAPVVAEVVDRCGEAGVKALVVVSAGFAETGDEGRRRQQELLERVRAGGMRMVGPNCLGIASTDPEVKLNASFASVLPPAGRAALCSQSGALGVAVIDQARRISLGLSAFVSVGNKADVAGHDLLAYWGDDPSTDVILFYLESFADPGRLGRVARKVGQSKPIMVVKSGRTEAGERAAGSHTAALAGAETAVDAFFRQTGMIRAGSLREMFDLARFLTLQKLPEGRKVAVVSNAGGPAILCTDALAHNGMDVPTLSDETRRDLEAFLPDAAATGNPVDMVASAGPEEYRRTIERVLGSGEVDTLVVIHTPVTPASTSEIEDAIIRAVEGARDAEGQRIPVLASVVGGQDEIYLLSGAHESIPAFPFPEEIGRVLHRAVSYREWREEEPGAFPDFSDQSVDEARRVCQSALAAHGEGWMSAEESRRVLEAGGLTLAEGRVATDADEAVDVAEDIGYPVVVKLASRTVVHKTELGMVKLGLEGPEAVRGAFREIRERMEREDELDSMEGVLIQPTLEGTAEVMIGVDPDPVFGPVLAFGLGGIHVEILGDLAFRVAPLSDRDVRAMTREIRGFKLLTGYRGHPEADIGALEEALLRLSRLVEQVPEIGQVDLNPVFVFEPGQGYRVADAGIEVVERRG
ncbi:MAG: acetate--CoA ligase family protein [Gemmatimonadota bacterium]